MIHAACGLVARFFRWLYLLGHEVRVHRHRGHDTTAYLSTQFPEEAPHETGR